MYTKFYGLKEQPFNLTPDPRFIYFSEKHREALARMTFGVTMRRGFMSITGEVGTGKTTLVYALLERLDADTQKAFIFHSILAAKGLFRSICREFEIDVKSEDTKTDMTMKLHNFLISNFSEGNNAVLIIDEAQNLNPQVLEEIRLLSNLETSRTKLLQILLVGQPELRDLLNRPDMRQIKQRIVLKFHLSKLNRKETGEYIHHRIQVVRNHDSDLDLPPEKLVKPKPGNGHTAASRQSQYEPLNRHKNLQELRRKNLGKYLSTRFKALYGDLSLEDLAEDELIRAQNATDIFLREAIDEIYEYSGGVPRLINVICDQALIMGYAIEARHITREIILKVLKEDQIEELSEEPVSKPGPVRSSAVEKRTMEPGQNKPKPVQRQPTKPVAKPAPRPISVKPKKQDRRKPIDPVKYQSPEKKTVWEIEVRRPKINEEQIEYVREQ